MRRALACAWPALLLALVVLAPHLGKAFTIDDTLFLRQAEHLRTDPLHPTAFDYVWQDAPRRVSTVMPSGPVMAWLLVPAVAVAGVDHQAEVRAHAVVLALLLLALVACARLALRLGFSDGEARLAALLLAATPVVLGMAATAMPDVPAMAFGVVGVERAIAWRDERRLDRMLLAALALALAMLARMHLALVVGVVLLAFVDGPVTSLGDLVRPTRAWQLAALVFGLAAIALRVTRDPAGVTSVGSAASFLSWRSLDRNLVSFGTHWVVALPLALPWLLVRARSLRWRLALVAVPALVGLLFAAGHERRLWIAPVAALGFLVVEDALERAWRSRAPVEIALAAWLVVPLPVALYINLPVKYFTAAAPAVALLVARALVTERPAARRNLSTAIVAASALLGLAIVRADTRFAELGRRAARELVAPHVAAGERVYFLGHWGFQWYAEHAGATCLAKGGSPPARGDVIVTAERASLGVHDLGEHLPPRRLLATVTDDGFGGRIMSERAGAGFYTSHYGYLPWSLAGDAIERFDAWRVE